jgi:hypothetical protein
MAALAGVAQRLGFFGPPAETIDLPIAISSDRLDFGTVPLHASVRRQLVVRNDSAEPVRARLSVENGSYRVSPEELILHPGISSRIEVALKADRLGALDDQLQILFETEGATPLMISLAGQAGETTTQDPSGSERLRASFETRTATSQLASSEPIAPEMTDGTYQPAPAYAVAEAAPAPGYTARSTAAVGNRSAANRISSGHATADSGSSSGVRITTNDPDAPVVPFRSISDTTPETRVGQYGEVRTEEPAKIPTRAQESQEPAASKPRTTPESLKQDNSLFDDIFDDDSKGKKLAKKKKAEEPLPATPALVISEVSSIRMLGAAAMFYPQELGVIGSDMGGAMNLAQAFQFPQVPLAFGESMLFSQVGPSVGAYDPATGSVTIQVPVQAMDTDGDAAPLTLNLTTGTVVARNESGKLVQLSGSPRAEAGALRLVAIERIPVGFKNGAEEHLVVLEILASLNFGPINEPGDSGLGIDG